MGKSNSKPFAWGYLDVSNLTGCAKIMCEKHGVYACKQLPLWAKEFGFPENGSFSVAKIQQLQRDLVIYQRKREVDWKAFLLWKSEAERRRRLQEKGRRRRGEETSQGETDTFPVSAAHPRSRNQQPVEPDPTVPGPQSSPAPPPYRQSVLEPAQSVLEPTQSVLEPTQSVLEPTQSVLEPAQSVLEPAQSVLEPAQSVLEHTQSVRRPAPSVPEPAQSVREPTQSVRRPAPNVPEPAQSMPGPAQRVLGPAQSMPEPAQSVRGPAQSTPGPAQRVLGPAQSTPDPRAHSGRTCSRGTQTIEIMEVPKPKEPEAAGMAAWTPEDLRSFAKDLPDLDPQGGTAFAEVLCEFVHQCKLSLREIKRLALYSIKLEWGKVQADWPETDLRYDWTRGAAYRGHVLGLCERIGTTFPPAERIDAVMDCVQKRGELVEDYSFRLEKVVKENIGKVGYIKDYMLTYYFLEGMDEQISSLLRKHVIGLKKMLISLVRLHAVHHERKLREAEEEKERARVLLKERWMKAQIQALQGGGGGGGRRGNYGCWNCGDPNHWARDCNRPRGGAQLCLTYVEEEEEEDEDSRGW